MKSKKITIFITTLAILSSILVYQGKYDLFAQNDIVVIVNKKLSKMTKAKINNYFLGRSSALPNGKKVKLLLNSDKSILDGFCSKYIQRSSSALKNLWLKKQIRDGVPIPRSVSSSLIVLMVGNSPDFIGFVKKSEVKGNVQIIE